MRRTGLTFLLVVGVVLGFAGIAFAQGGTYPLLFEYDDEADEYFAVVEVPLNAGDQLAASLQGGADFYFLVYTDDADLYEGETLDGFVAPAAGTVYVEVLALEEASGTVSVIGTGGGATTGGGESGMAPVASGDFAVSDCPFETPAGLDVTCGLLTVPENRLDAGSPTIDLAVAIIPSRSAAPAPDPIFYLEGGPGGSALAGIDSWYNSPYRDQRAIIVFDQRGTGFSNPSLNCPELDEADDAGAAESVCRDRLQAAGINLAAYNSRENAADVEALRQALGYERINLYGISYGTRLALTVMRDHPAGLRAVVLDSVYPPNVDTTSGAQDTFRLMSNMFADCAAQPACAGAYPDLEARFYAVLDQMNANPPLATDPDSGEQVELYPEDVLNTLYQQLQSTGLIEAIPASLDALATGDYDLYLELARYGAGLPADGSALAQELAGELTPEELAEINQLAANGDNAAIADYLNGIFELSAQEAQQAGQGFVTMASGGGVSAVPAVDPPDVDDDSEGMYWSVECHEEFPFLTQDQAAASAASIPPGLVHDVLLDGALSLFTDCSLWPAGSAGAVENQAVVSAIPTLVLAAQYDTATPPWWAELAAQTLSNSTTFRFPLVGHGVIDGGACPVGIGLAFFDNPGAVPDGSCISTMNTAFLIR